MPAGVDGNEADGFANGTVALVDEGWFADGLVGGINNCAVAGDPTKVAVSKTPVDQAIGSALRILIAVRNLRRGLDCLNATLLFRDCRKPTRQFLLADSSKALAAVELSLLNL